MKDINEWTRKEFDALPGREWDQEVQFDSLVILPTRQIHDSNYRCMDFVAVVIHINGIGGYGKDWFTEYWSIDCLKKSGLLRMFTHGKLTCGPALSSFELYSIKKV